MGRAFFAHFINTTTHRRAQCPVGYQAQSWSLSIVETTLHRHFCISSIKNEKLPSITLTLPSIT